MDKRVTRGRFQFVSCFPEWQGFGFVRCKHGLSLIYNWILYIGFFQIRMWTASSKAALERYKREAFDEFKKALDQAVTMEGDFKNWNRDKCCRTHVQLCHSCTSFDCCDNMNPEKK